jgi:hypothetical protein
VKRRLLKLGVFLLLGAIVNVAVAWGCDYWGPFSYPSHPPYGLKPGDEPARPPSEFPFEFLPEFRLEGNALGQTRIRYIGDDSRLYVFVEEYHIGLPMRCLYGEYWVAHPPHHSPERGGRASRYILYEPVNTKYVLPWFPVFPGFAINTIFYAAILALLFYGPGKVRRYVRVRRWRCPACAYLIAPGTCASGLCSECGATLLQRLVRASGDTTHD